MDFKWFIGFATRSFFALIFLFFVLCRNINFHWLSAVNIWCFTERGEREREKMGLLTALNFNSCKKMFLCHSDKKTCASFWLSYFVPRAKHEIWNPKKYFYVALIDVRSVKRNLNFKLSKFEVKKYCFYSFCYCFITLFIVLMKLTKNIN